MRWSLIDQRLRQPADASSSEAMKRETSLQDTPIAITAFSADLMEELNVNSPFMYEALVPSLTYQQEPNRLSIRGVTEECFPLPKT